MFRALRTLFYGLGLGAGAMYFYDPEAGRRRRTLVRDRAVYALNQADDAIGKGTRDLNNRARGMVAEARSLIRREEVPDDRLAERVRSRLGLIRVVSHPRAIQVTVENGRVILSGSILVEGVEPLLNAVRGIRGVRGVENRLAVHSAPDVPELQGQPATHSGDLSAQGVWAPGPRLLAALAGGFLTLSGMRRGGLMGLARSFIGLGVLVCSMTNRSLSDLLGFPENGMGYEELAYSRSPAGQSATEVASESMAPEGAERQARENQPSGGMGAQEVRQEAYRQVGQTLPANQGEAQPTPGPTGKASHPARQTAPEGAHGAPSVHESRRGPQTSPAASSAGSEQAAQDRESVQPGGGQGRVDEVGPTGIYPASDPDAPGDAEAQGMASWGQGERGAAGYEDSGTSELSGLGEETDLGSVIPGPNQE